ncbi:MAG: protein-disulfide reductase DsbD family protein [Bacteroidota bacterium]
MNNNKYRTLMRLCVTMLFLLFVSATAFPSFASDGHHTKVSLVADVRSVQPGSEFIVGVLMKMDPGWHTYWLNGGEAGLPTKIQWTLPDGITTGDIRWPLPHKYIEAGDVLTYGYEKENMLLVPMKASTTLVPGQTITLTAKIDWLECEHICVPGAATVSLVLQVMSAPPAGIRDSLVQYYARQVPAPIPPASDINLVSETRDGKVILVVKPKEGKFASENSPDFYPYGFDDIIVGRTSVKASSVEATLEIPLAAFEQVTDSRVFTGVLVYQLESGQRQSWVIDVPLPTEFLSTLNSALPSTGSVLDRQFVDTAADDTPLYLYILFAIIGGLLLNIMPCVLPVIALKIFGLVKIAGDSPAKVKRLGWMFSLGILVSFLALAVLVIALQSAGEQVGWGFQFQEPVFVMIMCTIVFVFGLSLFGVFEIRLPGSAASKIGEVLAGQETKRKGYAASFAEGVFATILATPCTAPFLGSALGFAFAQPWWVILLIFTSVSFGMALPYLILTTKPSWMKFLPKPGAWMESAKQFMGFLMMGTLIWLLFILGNQMGMEAVIWTSAFLLMVGLACWLVGRFATLTASRGRVMVIWSIALLAVIVGYALFLSDVVAARDVLGPSGSSSMQGNTKKGIQWESFTVAKLDAYLNEGKPVFIDFTADWCLTCKVNEKTVLADDEVIERFRSSGIVSLKADWTNRNPEITQLLAKFGRSGVPLYVVFPAGKPGEPIVLPEVITTGIVLEALDRAHSVTSTAITN